jgi:integrase
MRAHGEGSIRQRPDGRWEGAWRRAGRRGSLYGLTKAEVTTKLRAVFIDAERGVPQPSARLSTGAWLDRWLDQYVAPNLRPRTIESYRYVVAKHLQPQIGRIPLARLGPEDVSRAVGRLTGVSGTTRRYVYSVLRISLGRALKLGLVARNVATLIDPPRKDRRELLPLTADQIAVFLEATTDDRLGPLYVVGVGLGLRQGEALALRWADIDLDGGIVHVRHTLRRGDRAVAEPKTERSRRTLLLPAVVIAALRSQRVRQAAERLAAGRAWQDGDFVFTTPAGRPLDGVNVTHAFQAAVAAAGLPRQRFHDLRHAHATLLIEDGVELAVVSRALGHSDLSTTADTYGAWTRDMARRVANRMDTVLARKSAV